MWTTVISFLTPLLTSAKSFFLKNKLATIASVIAIILGILLWFSINRYQSEQIKWKIANANLAASKDSIRIEQDKEHQNNYVKLAYLAKTNNDLRSLNDSLYRQIKEIKGKVTAAVSTKEIIRDTGRLVVKVVHDTVTNTVYRADLSFDTVYSPGNFHHLLASVDLSNPKNIRAYLNKDEIGFTALTGVKKNNKGDFEIFFKPSYPGLSVTQLDGAIIDRSLFQKPDRRRIFTFGGSIGLVPLTYDWRQGRFELNLNRIGFSAGINANLSELLRAK